MQTWPFGPATCLGVLPKTSGPDPLWAFKPLCEHILSAKLWLG